VSKYHRLSTQLRSQYTQGRPNAGSSKRNSHRTGRGQRQKCGLALNHESTSSESESDNAHRMSGAQERHVTTAEHHIHTSDSVASNRTPNQGHAWVDTRHNIEPAAAQRGKSARVNTLQQASNAQGKGVDHVSEYSSALVPGDTCAHIQMPTELQQARAESQRSGLRNAHTHRLEAEARVQHKGGGIDIGVGRGLEKHRTRDRPAAKHAQFEDGLLDAAPAHRYVVCVRACVCVCPSTCIFMS
jgi:hypothetical protein